jgi:hypothetical protein
MARTYGAIITAIWTNPEFCQLTIAAQHTYLMLVTQTDISPVGILSVTTRRWSNYAADSTVDALSMSLQSLIDGRFVVVDWDREELLVRSFVKWDGGYTNTKRLIAIQSAAKAVASPELRTVLAGELDRLGVQHTIQICPIDAPSMGDGCPIDPRRVVVTEVGSTHNPHSATSNPHSGIPAASARPPRDRHAEAADPWLFTEFWNHYPWKTAQPIARAAWDIASKKHNPDLILAAVKLYAADPNREERFTMKPEKWLAGECWNDGPLPSRIPTAPAPKRSTTDDRVAQNLALVAEVAREENHRLQIGQR